jgi:hypothetical protein
VPALIADLGDEAAWRYVEFFTANIRNPNTRRAGFVTVTSVGLEGEVVQSDLTLLRWRLAIAPPPRF